MRIVVRIGSILAGIAYLALLWAGNRIGSLSDGSGGVSSNPANLLLVYPLVYLGICFYTSFAVRKGTNLLILGVSANALLIALAVGLCFMGQRAGFFCSRLHFVFASGPLCMRGSMHQPPHNQPSGLTNEAKDRKDHQQ